MKLADMLDAVRKEQDGPSAAVIPAMNDTFSIIEGLTSRVMDIE